MKKIFGPAWLVAWLSGILPDPIFMLGKKTPWYRQSWLRNVPWLAVALIAPLAIFLAWKGVERLLPKGGTDIQPADGQAALTPLT